MAWRRRGRRKIATPQVKYKYPEQEEQKGWFARMIDKLKAYFKSL